VTIEFRPAQRANISLLILLAGGTGSGKTESAMRLASGLAGGKRFALIDTENGRALHKADDYEFDHASLDEPFTPERYVEAVKAADAAGYPVIVIDSGSHEYDGAGGLLDIQAAEFQRLGATGNVSALSWSEPKKRDRRYRLELLRTHAHVILCLRAEDKIEIVKEGGKTVVRPLSTIPGKSIDGWAPICEKRLPFEATISLLLTADKPGVPKPIKLEARHRPLVPLDDQLDEKVGVALAEWAAGGAKKAGPAAVSTRELEEELLALADTLGKRGEAEAAIERKRGEATFPDWLQGQVERAREAVGKRSEAAQEKAGAVA
jgi:hypothetical protein